MIETQGLTRWYGDFLALDHLDLRLERGDLFGFIGPNGAGKTTTMKILATLLTPSSGVATVKGVNVVENPNAVRRLVGYMPDFFGVYREMRVSEYLAFFAAAYDVPAKQRRKTVEELLRLVDLSHKAEDVVGALSRGMQQRLGLARALVHDPEVLILDEPASGLDPRARVEMREILRELSSMGKTIILSSHILPELASICSHVGIIAHGRLLASGSIDEVASKVAPSKISVRFSPDDDETPPQARAVPLLEARFEGTPVAWDAHTEALVLGPLGEPKPMPHEVARVLLEAGLRLRHLEEVQPSLEEVFLQVTENMGLGEGAEAGGAKAGSGQGGGR
jgi:ABC-2 type transport system ATP-binding protein